MNEWVELRQAPDDSWTIEIQHESGIVNVLPMGKLSKEQAIREASRRGFSHIRCWDKVVMAAITSGKATISNG